jgi:hypothetical protein
MFFALFVLLLLLNGGVGVLVWLGWQRVASHLKADPEAARLVSKVIAEHIIPPLLVGQKESKAETKPEVKTVRGTLV